MENIISRHRNLTILAVVLFAQILGLAVQVKKGTDQGSTRLIRVWAVSAITPFAKGVVHTSNWFSDTWRDYLYLRGVRTQNEKLRDEIERLRLEQVRMTEDAHQARRLQALLGFKEQFISQTMPAQVISTTGSEFSRGIYIDKGSRAGIKPDMPVITAEGIVGKILRVYPTSSLVLEINDPSSGAGVILEKSRLQGILKGSPNGQTFVANIMADEKIEVGERILSSGGDRVYPKGLEMGTVSRVTPAGTFLNVEVKPAARLNQLEEVLVITKIVEKAPEVNDQNGPIRAIDVLAQRLPSVPPPKKEETKPPAANPAAAAAQPSKPGVASETKPKLGPIAKPAVPGETTGETGAEKKPAASPGLHAPTPANAGQRAPATENNSAAAHSVLDTASGTPERARQLHSGPASAAASGNPAKDTEGALRLRSGQAPTAGSGSPAKPENPTKDTPP